jgi:molecular chaperone Hsp33
VSFVTNLADAAPRSDDLIQPFKIEASGLHGRLVRLGPALHQPLTSQDYPDSVAILLGECLTLSAGLAAALKFDGTFSVQAKGDGPVRMIVADATNSGAIRGYAQFEGPAPTLDEVSTAPIPRLLGAGYMAFTVDQGPDSERYQGIVDLEGATLGDCVHHYFQTSDQFSTAVKISVARDAAGYWRGGALILQRSPEDENPLTQDDAEEAWRRAVILMGSCTPDEMVDPSLAANQLLYRLFHEDGVRVFDPQPIAFACKCTPERMAAAVAMLTLEELHEMTVDGAVTVTCQFCNAGHVFDEAALRDLRPADAAF